MRPKIKKCVRLNFLLFLTLILVSCDINQSDEGSNETLGVIERRELPRSLSEAELHLVDGSMTFGFNLFRHLQEESPEDNIFISPLSITMAYAMTMNGADGETYEQMRNVLGFDGMSQEQVNESLRSLLDLMDLDEKVKFTIANSIWYRDTFQVEKEFLDMNRNYYEAEVEAADFGNPQMPEIINQWVSDATEGLINEIVGEISPEAIMYLLNAIYFRGEWSYAFNPDETRGEPFYLSDGTSVEVPMMKMDEAVGLPYNQTDDYQAVDLFYGDAGFAMTVLLPGEEVVMSGFLETLNADRWQEITEDMQERQIKVTMPKFEMKYEIDAFPQVLQDLGMVNAFDAGLSDFSGMSRNSGKMIYIGESQHKTFISVDEEGTEAAAVTSVNMYVTSIPSIAELRLDRPFFFAIREVESNTILFMGKMMNPS